jgi:hypothetical protein
MRRSDKFANPFYGLLLAAGILFAVTAFALFVTSVRKNTMAQGGSGVSSASVEHPLVTWMSRHGDVALAVELAVLAIGTVGAIATDDYWQRKAAAARKSGPGQSRNPLNCVEESVR